MTAIPSHAIARANLLVPPGRFAHGLDRGRPYSGIASLKERT